MRFSVAFTACAAFSGCAAQDIRTQCQNAPHTDPSWVDTCIRTKESEATQAGPARPGEPLQTAQAIPEAAAAGAAAFGSHPLGPNPSGNVVRRCFETANCHYGEVCVENVGAHGVCMRSQ
jgi:hypothetical protein